MEVLDSFPGPLYPINPRATEILGRPAHPTLVDVPDRVDLVMIAVPPQAVPAVIEDCRAADVGAAVICTGGFAESGDEGAVLQAEVTRLARDAGIRLLGPNTSGFVSPHRSLHATFMPDVHEIKAGSLGIVAQSGGVNLAATFMASQRGCGVSLAVGLGNAVDVDFVDVLDHMAKDPATTAIALHVEGVADGRALMAAVRRASAIKPVVAFKVGKNDVGDFAKSHTGAMAGNWAVARAGLQQAGAVVVDSLTDMVDAASALTVMRLAPRKEPGIGIVTGQAGPGLIINDSLSTHGVSVPSLANETTRRLADLLPPLTYQRNPVDTGRPGPTFAQVIETVGNDAGIDALVVYALQESGTAEVTRALCDPTTRDSFPPVLMATGGAADAVAAQRGELRGAGYAACDSPDRAAFAMSALVEDARGQHRLREGERTRPTDGSDSDPLHGSGLLDEFAGKDVLGDIGIRTPRRAVCASTDEAEARFEAMTPPVVIKILDANVTHKSAAGGVALGIATKDALHQALATTAANTSAPRWLIEEQAAQGIELIVGGVRDSSFGSALLVGAGGTSVEWGQPPQVRTVPLLAGEAGEIVSNLPPALHNALGATARSELETVLEQVADFLADHPEVAELDINPLRATPSGLIALDAVVRIDHAHTPQLERDHS